ncbi:unnamed protein product [Symbiodinium natans]|uniref:Fe2OG dioxygenase domain-containing protein n=1 Tax=Symbiodinium natans TaxID=878477 RepID=A0A812QFR0_9DINO|nr:unnamed protein product [Symbiodinium natans]
MEDEAARTVARALESHASSLANPDVATVGRALASQAFATAPHAGVASAVKDPPEESQRVGKESAPADTDDAWDLAAAGALAQHAFRGSMEDEAARTVARALESHASSLANPDVATVGRALASQAFATAPHAGVASAVKDPPEESQRVGKESAPADTDDAWDMAEVGSVLASQSFDDTGAASHSVPSPDTLEASGFGQGGAASKGQCSQPGVGGQGEINETSAVRTAGGEPPGDLPRLPEACPSQGELEGGRAQPSQPRQPPAGQRSQPGVGGQGEINETSAVRNAGGEPPSDLPRLPEACPSQGELEGGRAQPSQPRQPPAGQRSQPGVGGQGEINETSAVRTAGGEPPGDLPRLPEACPSQGQLEGGRAHPSQPRQPPAGASSAGQPLSGPTPAERHGPEHEDSIATASDNLQGGAIAVGTEPCGCSGKSAVSTGPQPLPVPASGPPQSSQATKVVGHDASAGPAKALPPAAAAMVGRPQMSESGKDVAVAEGEQSSRKDGVAPVRQKEQGLGLPCGEERMGRSNETRDSSATRSRPPQPWEQHPLLPPPRANSRQELGGGPSLGNDMQVDLQKSDVAAGPGQMSSGAMAPEVPRSSLEGAEDRRAWVVQGTIHSVPPAPPAPPAREASPYRSASPGMRPSEARPFYELMREMREMWSAPSAPSAPQPLQPPQAAQAAQAAQPPQAPLQASQLPSQGPGAPSAGALPAPGALQSALPAPETQRKPSKSVEVQAELASRDFSREQLQLQDFRSKLQGARQLLPELRGCRRDLDSAVQAIEARSGELRQRCAEAEREALEDFEVLRNHLNSVESLKQAVLTRERDVRLRLAGQIEDFCQRLLQADGSSHSSTAAAFRAEFPDLHAAADALCSRACSLPQVEVPIDDVPFEARMRADKLRRHVVAERLLRAKDMCLWRMEQQRRQLIAETSEGAEWIRHLGSMLDRYAEELGHVCYFCSERFSAASANTRCAWNQAASPSGRALSPDRRVPQQLWGGGVHFWVPLPSPVSAAAAAAVAAAGSAQDYRDLRDPRDPREPWASAPLYPPPPPWADLPEAWPPPPPQVSAGSTRVSRASSPTGTRYAGKSVSGPASSRRDLAAFGQGPGDAPVPLSRGPAAFVERRCGGGGPLPAAEVQFEMRKAFCASAGVHDSSGDAKRSMLGGGDVMCKGADRTDGMRQPVIESAPNVMVHGMLQELCAVVRPCRSKHVGFEILSTNKAYFGVESAIWIYLVHNVDLSIACGTVCKTFFASIAHFADCLRASDSKVAEGDLVEAERLLAASADVTPALHLALQIGAAPETVELLAACCSRLNVWLPEPAVVTWARATCRAALSGRRSSLRGATAKLDALLLAGADINSIGRGCETALHILARTFQARLESHRYAMRSQNLARDVQDVVVKVHVHDMQAQAQALMRAWLMERVRQLLKGRLDTLVHLTIFRSEYSTVCVTMSDELRLMRLMLPIVATPSVFICFHSCLICDEAVCHAVYGSSGLEEEDLCHAPLSECQAPLLTTAASAASAAASMASVACRRGVQVRRRAWRSWAEQLGIEAPKVELASLKDTFGNDLRGMIATSSIDMDEAIITVPSKRALQVTTGGSCPAGENFAATEDWQNLPWWAQLGMLVLREAKSGDSFLKEWTASLPRDFPDLPMNWTEEELELLEYQPILRQIQKQRHELQVAFAQAQKCSLDFTEAEFTWAVQVVRSRAFSGPYEGRNAQDRLVQLAFAATLWLPRAQRSLLWQIFPIVLLHLVHPSDSVFAVCTPSFCTALSGALRVLFAELRTFSVFSSLDRSLSVLRAGVGAASGALSLEASLNGALAVALAIPLQDFLVGQTSQLKRHVVCPVVDYLNHDSNAISDIAYEYFGNVFAVRVNGTFQDGEEVCINYGEKRSNDTLLQFYGFVERDNANDTYTLDLLQYLDEEAAASGQTLEVRLSRTGPDDESFERLLLLLAGGCEADSAGRIGASEEAMAWKAVAIACEAELQRRSAGAARELDMEGTGARALAARFAAEKEKVLLACRAHAESRCRPASSAPLSVLSRATVLPSYQDAAAWQHEWASGVFGESDLASLLREGFVILPGAFDESLALNAKEECQKLDASATTVTTNRCNRGSRSAWLDFGEAEGLAELEARLPALSRLGRMLAGLPARVHGLGGFGEALKVHPAAMIAVYPEQAAQYALHKDSYAPSDNDPATGATRRLTILAYLNDWQEGHGGELRLHAGDTRPDPRRFQSVEPKAGTVVVFDSRRVWHAVAPSLSGNRWAMTLWVH